VVARSHVAALLDNYAARPMSSNEEIARAWLEAFNKYDVDALVALYVDDATHTSPKIRAMYPEALGMLRGRDALAKWWRESNARLPGLRSELTALTANDDRVFIEYIRHVPENDPMPVAEVFDIEHGKIVASRVYHG
jgi:limonene-1,2-epoxide hydrolase